MKSIILLLVLLFLVSCKNPNIPDVTTAHTHRELLDFLTKQSATQSDHQTKSVVDAPKPISPLFNKIVSLNVDEKVDLKHVFKQLAHQAKISLILNKNVTGRINYRAHKQPLLEIIDNICMMANLRYRIDHDVMWIEKDLPYLKTYNVQFLSMSRSTENLVSINSNLFGKKEEDKDLANGSSSIISSKATVDFWQELDNSLSNILQLSTPSSSDEETIETIEEKNDSDDGESNHSSDDKKIRHIIQKKKKSASKKTSFAIHKQAGIISIFATEKQHRSVKDFITRLRKKTSTQILIEAKVVEVQLKQEYKSGIDWQRIGNYGFSYAGGG